MKALTVFTGRFVVDRRRWLLALLSGAALILFPGPADQATAPGVVARAGTLPDDGAPEAGDAGGRPDDPPGLRPGADQPQPPAGPSLCRPGRPPSAPPTTRYLDDNPLLGPARLPTASPLGPLLAGYQRFGGLTDSRFLTRYTTGTPAGYVFPPANGFVVNLTVQWLVDHRFLVEESVAGTAGECVTDSVPRRGGAGGGVPAVHVF